MKTDIVLAGVGGQGILTIAAALGMAALRADLHLKQSEVHGMSQRGGAVQSHLRISDRDILSDLIPLGTADVILSVEPMESLRYLSYLHEDGWLVTNSVPVVNINDYPAMEQVLDHVRSLPRHIILDADAIARECGSARSSNIVMLGASSLFLCCLSERRLEESIRELFSGKGEEVVEANLRAFRAGKQFAREHKSA